MLWAKLRCRTTTYDQESVLKIKSKPETQRSTDFSAAPFRRRGGGVQMTSYCLGSQATQVGNLVRSTPLPLDERTEKTAKEA